MRKSLVLSAIVGFAFATTATMSMAGDVDAGKKLGEACAKCHGADGKGKAKNPPIVGMDEATAAAKLRAYKTGEKKNAMMEMAVKKLSDADIDNLAAYVATLK